MKPITKINIYETVLCLLKDEPKGTLLDLGANEGVLTARMAKLGFHVTACDISPSDFKPKLPFKRADLNKRFPFKASQFDTVTCVEVMEHLESPYTLFREVSRVLKPGGIFILTTPNITHYYSKLQFMFRNTFYAFEWNDTVRIRDEYGHINPVTLNEIRHCATINSLKIIARTYNRGTLALPHVTIPILPKIDIFGEILIVKMRKLP